MSVTNWDKAAAARLVVFTDLDGTLLDALTYSFAPARDALGMLEAAGAPLVICTSKTRAEILGVRRALGNDHPFVSENGGGVFVPAGYFGDAVPNASAEGGMEVVRLGTGYAVLREALEKLRSMGFRLRGFGDMTAREVAELTGLPEEEAALAREREFDEPFVLMGGPEDEKRVEQEIRRMGLNFTRGRLMHILGDNDKGRAVRVLAGLYGKTTGRVVTAALGDSPNDLPMLDEVDYPFVVRKPEGMHDQAFEGSRARKVDGVGPAGWAEAVTGLLEELGLAGGRQ